MTRALRGAPAIGCGARGGKRVKARPKTPSLRLGAGPTVAPARGATDPAAFAAEHLARWAAVVLAHAKDAPDGAVIAVAHGIVFVDGQVVGRLEPERAGR